MTMLSSRYLLQPAWSLLERYRMVRTTVLLITKSLMERS
jgi:hypothetical protein